MESNMTFDEYATLVREQIEVGGFELTEKDTKLFLKPANSILGFGLLHTLYSPEEAINASLIILALIIIGRERGLIPIQTLDFAFMFSFSVSEYMNELSSPVSFEEA